MKSWWKTIEEHGPYNWIRTRLNFHLLRSCLLCLRGSRSTYKRDDLADVDITLVTNEAKLTDDVV